MCHLEIIISGFSQLLEKTIRCSDLCTHMTMGYYKKRKKNDIGRGVLWYMRVEGDNVEWMLWYFIVCMYKIIKNKDKNFKIV